MTISSLKWSFDQLIPIRPPTIEYSMPDMNGRGKTGNVDHSVSLSRGRQAWPVHIDGNGTEIFKPRHGSWPLSAPGASGPYIMYSSLFSISGIDPI